MEHGCPESEAPATCPESSAIYSPTNAVLCPPGMREMTPNERCEHVTLVYEALSKQVEVLSSRICIIVALDKNRTPSTVSDWGG